MKISDMTQARRILASYIPDANKLHLHTLKPMRQLMRFLGNPQNKLKIIHIAGTSGKTSTAYYAAALLQAGGHKVGMTVSPHIVDVNERLQINIVPLPEAEFCKILSEFLTIIESCPVKPSYFELLVALSYWFFDKIKVDYAIIEVGIGGTLDATNVIRSKQKVCVVTDIGYDHTEVLGKSLSSIAGNKAGIIGQSNQVFMHPQGRAIMRVIKSQVRAKSANLSLAPPTIDNKLTNLLAPAMLPLFQQRNFSLGLAATNYITARDRLKPLTSSQLFRAASTIIPGRLELVYIKNKKVLLDGAHNPQKIATLGSSLQHMFPNQKSVALVNFVNNTSPHKLKQNLVELAKFCDAIIITNFNASQDLPRPSLDARQVAKVAREYFQEVSVETNFNTAVNQLVRHTNPLKLITGSLYLVSQVKNSYNL